jgi:hypothetical protein
MGHRRSPNQPTSNSTGTHDDLPIFYEHQLDPDATRMAAFPSRGWDAFLAHWTKILANEAITTKTILFNGGVAGSPLPSCLLA